jgi:outer membrane murein-binding lipoprotein Lpp
MKVITAIGASLILLAGCASHPPPSDHLASAIAATRAAQEAGAARIPRGALQLKLAEEQIAQARKMMENGDNERADYMTLRAYNDAELALAIARDDAARKSVEQASVQSPALSPGGQSPGSQGPTPSANP